MRLAGYFLTSLAVLGTACVGTTNPTIAIAGSGTSSATHLVFTVQPTSTIVNVAILPPIQVAAQNSFGSADTTYANGITIAIASNANPGGATLSGTLTVTPVRGVATFNNISINSAGSGYRLLATAPSVASATSATFNITP